MYSVAGSSRSKRTTPSQDIKHCWRAAGSADWQTPPAIIYRSFGIAPLPCRQLHISTVLRSCSASARAVEPPAATGRGWWLENSFWRRSWIFTQPRGLLISAGSGEWARWFYLGNHLLNCYTEVEPLHYWMATGGFTWNLHFSRWVWQEAFTEMWLQVILSPGLTDIHSILGGVIKCNIEKIGRL